MLGKLQEIVRQFTDNEEIVISGDMVLLTDLGLNSCELVEMVCKVEDAFNVEIPDRTIRKFKTVQDVVDYIAANESEAVQKNISLHINNCYRENELDKSSTVKKSLTVEKECKRNVRRNILSLASII